MRWAALSPLIKWLKRGDGLQQKLIVDKLGVFKLLYDERLREADGAAGGFYKDFSLVYPVIFIIPDHFIISRQAHQQFNNGIGR